MNTSDKYESRRTFLKWGLGALSAAAGAGGATGLLAYLAPPEHALKKAGGWRAAGSLAKLGETGVMQVTYFNLPVFLVLDRGQLRAYSAICPHLGCLVHWDPERRSLPCPCHASTFSIQGEVEGGPARPYSLLRHRVRAEGDVVLLEMPEPAELDRYASWLRYVIRSGG